MITSYTYKINPIISTPYYSPSLFSLPFIPFLFLAGPLSVFIFILIFKFLTYIFTGKTHPH